VKTEKPLIEEQQSNFFKAVSESKEVTKGFGMLANCMSGMKLELSQFQMIWERYSEIWTVDREEYVDSLARKKPRLKDFEDELHRQCSGSYIGFLNMKLGFLKKSLKLPYNQENLVFC